ncbi:MAG: hypothetical protein ACRDRK_09945 [Pseudonocardia sp.]
MRFYAERPGRAGAQLLADVLVLGWVAVCVTVAQAARALIGQLEAPGRALVDSGDAIRGTFDDAARTAGGVPFVGDDLARAFATGTGAGESLAEAGRGQVEAVSAVALGAAVGIVLLAAVPVVLIWLLLRVRYARAAGSAIAARRVDTDLLALRAMTRLPIRQLLSVSPDPAAAWRHEDRAVVGRLAALELASLGLRAPTIPPG